MSPYSLLIGHVHCLIRSHIRVSLPTRAFRRLGTLRGRSGRLDMGVRVKRHHIHFAVSSDDHDFLSRTARDRDETVAAFMRRIIRQIRRNAEARGGGDTRADGSLAFAPLRPRPENTARNSR